MKKLLLFITLLTCIQVVNSQINVGLTATASHSSGGTSGTGYGPELYNNNAIPTCAITGTYQWGWVTSGANIDYIWSSNQTFDQIIFNKANRPMTSCAIQYWNGSSYVTFYNYNNSTTCDHGITFSSITTSRLRFSNIQGSSNPNFREIQVISNCTPPTAATSMSGGGTLCAGNNTTLAASGGTLGTNATEVWFAGSCNEAYSQNWGTQPFSVSNTTVNSVTNGILRVTSTNGEPMIHMNNLGSFDPTVYRYINLRYRVVSGTAGSTEIFFHNPTHNYAVGGETGFGSLISDGQWHVLSIDMWQDPQYTTGGNIQGWRYDWATASGVTMDLDFISLDEKPIIGAGSSITVTPTATTTYYTHRKGDCGVSSCASTTVNYVYIPAPPSVSNNGPVCIGAPADLTVAGMAPSGKGVSMANNSTNKINGTAHTTVLNNHTIEFWVNPGRTVVLHTEQNSGVSGSLGSPTTEYSFAIEPRNIGGSGCTPTNVGVGVSVGTNGIEVVQHGPCHFPVTLSYAGTITGWTHIAVVHISNVPYLYVNGALVKSGLPSLYPTFPSSIVSMGYGYFGGQIDNIRVWNLARSQTNIINDMRLETPTVTTGLLQNLPLNGNGTALTGSNATVNGTYIDPNYYTYTWTGTSAPAASVNETQTTGNLTTNTSYTVTASVSGCTSAASGTTTVTVDPVGIDGTLTASTATSVCIGEAIGVSASGGNGTPHYWVQSPPGNASWNVYTNQNPNAASNGFTFTPTTPGTYRIHARWENACGFCWDHPSGMANCTSNAHVDFVVSANPSPAATAGADQFSCLSNTTTMAANNPTIGTGTWTWSPSAPTYVSGNANTYNAQVSFSTSGTYTGTWTITNGTCTATNDAVDIEVNNPNPIVMTDATGTCTVTDNAWVHIYNAAGN
ncbi:MAG: hypothetical protein KDE33_04330, partial [Bacteroidetes bacterium]|nr:hypothetical protein [Bacteroidota bacterium]